MKPKPLLAEKPSIKLTDVVHDMMINKAIREAVGEPIEGETETGRQRAYSFADEYAVDLPNMHIIITFSTLQY